MRFSFRGPIEDVDNLLWRPICARNSDARRNSVRCLKRHYYQLYNCPADVGFGSDRNGGRPVSGDIPGLPFREEAMKCLKPPVRMFHKQAITTVSCWGQRAQYYMEMTFRPFDSAYASCAFLPSHIGCRMNSESTWGSTPNSLRRQRRYESAARTWEYKSSPRLSQQHPLG